MSHKPRLIVLQRRMVCDAIRRYPFPEVPSIYAHRGILAVELARELPDQIWLGMIESCIAGPPILLAWDRYCRRRSYVTPADCRLAVGDITHDIRIELGFDPHSVDAPTFEELRLDNYDLILQAFEGESGARMRTQKYGY